MLKSTGHLRCVISLLICIRGEVHPRLLLLPNANFTCGQAFTLRCGCMIPSARSGNSTEFAAAQIIWAAIKSGRPPPRGREQRPQLLSDLLWTVFLNVGLRGCSPHFSICPAQHSLSVMSCLRYVRTAYWQLAGAWGIFFGRTQPGRPQLMALQLCCPS